jgi:hypothetical protein
MVIKVLIKWHPLKKRKTSINNLGVENPFQSKEIKNKIKKTNLERYGFENPSQSKEIRDKIKQTNMSKYGVDNPSKLKMFSDKALNTMIVRYGEVWLKHAPTYNPNSIIYLDLLSEKWGIKIQHALNGGEKKFVKYWVDGYIEEYNICIEWDEIKHYSKNQKRLDVEREEYIIKNFGCNFIRINEFEFLNNIDNGIQKLTEELEKNKNKYLKIK